MTNYSNRVFLDTMVLANLDDPIDVMEREIEWDYTLVIPNTVVDVKAFQENPGWLKKHLHKGEIVIQMWMTPDEMVRKAFTWSSCGKTTQPAECFEDAIESLPNWEGIMEVKELMMQYGLHKDEWEPAKWIAPEPLSKEYQEILGVRDNATRTEILAASKFTGHMDIFELFSERYNRALARQHHCGFLLTIGGILVEV